jgi:hypothetical protein
MLLRHAALRVGFIPGFTSAAASALSKVSDKPSYAPLACFLRRSIALSRFCVAGKRRMLAINRGWYLTEDSCSLDENSNLALIALPKNC